MSQIHKKQAKKVTSTEQIRVQDESASQQEQQHQFVHLQTILMLSQLNSAYYELKLTLQNATNRLENVYLRLKMKAFLAIQQYQHDFTDIRAQISQLPANKYNCNSDSEQIQFEFEDDRIIMKEPVQLQSQTALKLKCDAIFKRVSAIISLKQKCLISHAIHYMKMFHETSTIQINSQKSSKLETNDSHKSKIFRRSVERKANRKSFSLERACFPSKNDYYVPVKYQPSKLPSPILSKTDQSISRGSQKHPSNLNKFLQDRGDMNSIQRKNNFMGQRDKKGIKYNSSKKYSNMSLTNQKQQKVKQLQYLRKKYKRLMTQFNEFSDRFLKVIQQEEYVK